MSFNRCIQCGQPNSNFNMKMITQVCNECLVRTFNYPILPVAPKKEVCYYCEREFVNNVSHHMDFFEVPPNVEYYAGPYCGCNPSVWKKGRS